MVADRLIVSWRWQLLLAPVGARISFLDNLGIYSGSQAAAHVLPLDVVADALRASWVARRGPALGTVAATIVVERMLSVMVSSGLSLLAVLFLGLDFLNPGWAASPSSSLSGPSQSGSPSCRSAAGRCSDSSGGDGGSAALSP